MNIALTKLSSLLLVVVATSACSTFDRGALLGGGEENFAAGTALGAQLGDREIAALESAFKAAMDTGAAQTWSARRANGAVTPGGFAVGNLLTDPRQRLPLNHRDVTMTQTVETDLGLYVLTRNSNIRKGPGTEYGVLEMLPAGSGVDVVGRVTDKNWMMIAADGVVRGYVYGNLLIKAPGTELELAGGPMRKPVLCRDFRQELSVYGSQDKWTGAACNDGTGWRLADDPPMPDQLIDDELMGL